VRGGAEKGRPVGTKKYSIRSWEGVTLTTSLGRAGDGIERQTHYKTSKVETQIVFNMCVKNPSSTGGRDQAYLLGALPGEVQ